MPCALAMGVVATFAFFSPLVNAPILGVLTVRTPKELRPKVMAAVMTVATMAGPLGFIAAGVSLRYISLSALFVGLPPLLTLGGLAFAGVLLRHRAAPDVAAVPQVAHG